MKASQIDIGLLENSLMQLEEGLNPKNLLERDGAIQRFEFTFELSWKTLAKVLQSDKPLVDNSVKGILREGGKQNLIEDVEKWFEFQIARNKTSHTYNNEVAIEVFALAQKFPPYVRDLITRVKTRLQP